MLTQKRLKELLEYNKYNGVFTRTVRTANSVHIGDTAGGISGDGYHYIRVDGKKYKSHRLAWLYIHGHWPKDQIDHINHDRVDNRIVNLREATNVDNHRNRGMNCNNTSGCTGVHWHRQSQKWQAQIRVEGRQIYLGLFGEKRVAIATRKQAEKQYGFHVNHGGSR